MVESAVLATPPLLPCTFYPVPAALGRTALGLGCSTHSGGAPQPAQAFKGSTRCVAQRVPTPPMPRLPGPSIWDFLRYFLALDSDLKTVEKAPTRPHRPRPTLSSHSRPTLSPHFHIAPLSPRPTQSPRSLTPRPTRTGAKASKSDSAARKHVGFLTLMPSTFITWIFAKSINNSATLGGRFGLLGGVAYAGGPPRPPRATPS